MGRKGTSRKAGRANATTVAKPKRATARSTRSVSTARLPASQTPGAKACHLVACPDELPRMSQSGLPVVPTESTAMRFEHLASCMDGFYLRNFSVIANIPGQTSYAARAATTVGGINAGSMILLNMGSANLMWDAAACGIAATAAPQYTLRCAPDYHLGYIQSSDTAKPHPPAPITYIQNATTSGLGVYVPFFDGTNYFFGTLCDMNTDPAQVLMTLVADVTIVAPTAASWLLTGNHVAPFTPTSGFASNGATCDFQIVVPSNGAPVRSLFQMSGVIDDDPAARDNTFFPNYTVACNFRVEANAALTAASGTLQAYAVGAGADGPYNGRITMSSAQTYAAVAQSWANIGARARQHSMGVLNPSNPQWYACNIASRLGGVTNLDAPIIADFSCVGLNEVPDSFAPSAALPAQDSTYVGYPYNSQFMGWGHRPTVGLVVFQTGSTSGTSTYPIGIEAWTWIEAHMNSNTGLAVKSPEFVPAFANWLGVINSYPVLASADSFKDYLSQTWKAFKSGAEAIGRGIRGTAVHMMRDAIVEALILAAVSAF